MRIITLTTDWKIQDFYPGAVKGEIYSSCPDTIVVDLAHEIPAFNIRQTAFVIRNAYPRFPAGTIHIISVLSQDKSLSAGPLLAVNNDHFFILPDAGLITLIFPDGPDKVYRLKQHKRNPSFPVINDFLPAVTDLVKGKAPENIGEITENYRKTTPVRAAYDESVITGSIMHIDSYRNAITNIQKTLFERVGKKRSFIIFPGSNHYQITRISTSYGDVDPGDIFALFNSLDLLEIGIYQGNAAELLGLTIHSTIRINFKDK